MWSICPTKWKHGQIFCKDTCKTALHPTAQWFGDHVHGITLLGLLYTSSWNRLSDAPCIPILYTCVFLKGLIPSNASMHVNFFNFYEMYLEKITLLLRKHICLCNKFWTPSSIIKSLYHLVQPTSQLFLLRPSNVPPLEQARPITRLLIPYVGSPLTCACPVSFA